MIRVIKYWNRENGKVIPSYHIEEVAINISSLVSFENYEVNIREWFNYAETYLNSTKFKSTEEYNKTIDKIKKVKTKFSEAKTKLDEKKQAEAIQIWKEIFGKEFPTISIDEAKSFSSSLSNGTLKAAASGIISQSSGNSIPKSKGYFGEIF
jgi:ribosomal protein L14E/L6E/L27E